jgi:hypothetical protein
MAHSADPHRRGALAEHHSWWSKAGSSTVAAGRRLTDWPHARAY